MKKLITSCTLIIASIWITGCASQSSYVMQQPHNIGHGKTVALRVIDQTKASVGYTKDSHGHILKNYVDTNIKRQVMTAVEQSLRQYGYKIVENAPREFTVKVTKLTHQMQTDVLLGDVDTEFELQVIAKNNQHLFKKTYRNHHEGRALMLTPDQDQKYIQRVVKDTLNRMMYDTKLYSFIS